MALLSASFTSLSQNTTLKGNAFYPTQSQPKQLKSADLNGDDRPDLVVVNDQYNGLTVHYRGNNLVFSEADQLGVVGQVNDVVAADFDLDGDQDLWVGMAESTESHDQDLLLVNDGNGTFAQNTLTLAHNSFFLGTDQLEVADFNGDGLPDVLRIQRRPVDKPVGAFIYINNGNLGFNEIELTVVLGKDVVVSDFDQDGDLDIGSLEGSFEIFLNDGQGGFSDQSVLATNLQFQDYSNVAFADINQDGLMDIQFFHQHFGLPRSINQGNGQFESESFIYLDSPGIQNGTFVDMNDDGVLDLWLVHQNNNPSEVILSATDGFIDFDVNFSLQNENNRAMAVDVSTTGEGAEIVTLGTSGLKAWGGSSQNGFQYHDQAPINGAWLSPVSMTLADMDGDGKNDVVTIDHAGVSVARGINKTQFNTSERWIETDVFRGYLADINQDGLVDVASINQSGGIRLMINNGQQGFDVQVVTQESLAQYRLALTDVDQDGDVDMIAQAYLGDIKVFENQAGVFDLSQTISGGFASLQVMDMNNDGQVELLALNYLPTFGEIDLGFIVYTFTGGAFNKLDVLPSTASPTNHYLMQPFKGDEHQQLLILDSGQYYLVSFNGTELLVENAFPGLTGVYPSQTADINGDGVWDFFNIFGQVQLSDGGGFNESTFHNRVGDIHTATGDVDGDTDVDVVVYDSTYGFTTYINTRIDQDFSGLWFNLEQSGHGLQVEEVVSNGIPQVNLAWYVYHNGEPMWVTGAGPVDGDSATIPLYITSGAEFGSGFNSADVLVEAWGSMTLTMTGQNTMVMDWDGSDYGFSTGSMTLSRLSNLKAVDQSDEGIQTCHSGSWYAPSESGHGYLVQVIDGDPARMILTWFTYLDGQQHWMIADGLIEGDQATLTAYQASGPNFPPDYNAGDYQQSVWGSITFKVNSNDGATVTWQPDDPAFEAGILDVVKLTHIDRYRCL